MLDKNVNFGVHRELQSVRALDEEYLSKPGPVLSGSREAFGFYASGLILDSEQCDCACA